MAGKQKGVKCRKCGHRYHRSYCDYCQRADNYERRYKAAHLSQFTPRVQKDLQELDIVVDAHHLSVIRSGKGLFIQGVTGSGKTLYAAKLMLESMRMSYVEQSTPAPQGHLLVSVVDVLDQFRSSFSKSFEEVMDIGNLYTSEIEFLVLDDLGVSKTTDWVIEKLYQIINGRYEKMLPTIFTSNLTGAELAERLGDRIPSRITQMCEFVDLGKTDYRLQNRKK